MWFCVYNPVYFTPKIQTFINQEIQMQLKIKMNNNYKLT